MRFDVPGASVMMHPKILADAGFSVKLKSARATRLFFDELQRQQTGAKLPVRERLQKHRARLESPRVAVQRQPLLSQDDLERQFLIELARRGKDPSETEKWPAAVQQTRVSRLEQGTSTAPIRQIEQGARYMVDWKLRPVHLCHEETSGSIYRRRRRRIFEQFFDDVEHDRIRDPLTGEPVRHIVCFQYDRFTREPGEGERWIELLRRKGFGLHESDSDMEPRTVAKSEDAIRSAWNNGAREVKRLRERVINALERIARAGTPIYGVDHLFGHVRDTHPETGKTVGYDAHPEQQPIVYARAQELIDGASIHSVQCWLNDNGYLNAHGNEWSHKSVENLFRSPRLAGLVRLKIDIDRYFDESYEGELFPTELIYGPGEGPDPDFDPPIEPLMPYPMWVELQAALDKKKVGRRGRPRQQRFASGRMTCSECEDNMIGGMRDGTWVYRCAKRHLEGKSRSNADHRAKKAHDGLRHPVVQGEVTDSMLEEIIFAAVDRDHDPADALPTIDIQARREQLEDDLRAIAAKLGDVSHMLRHGRINRVRYDEWCDELDEERDDLRAQLAVLDETHPVELLAEGVTLRELWDDMPFERRCQWLDIVFKKIVVRPASNIGGLNIASRFEFEFADAYEPPVGELEELLRLIEVRYRQEKAGSRVPREVEEEMFQWHLEGRHPDEIAEMLAAKGLRGPRGGTWSYNVVTYVLKRICAEQKVAYVAVRRRRWFELRDETLELMVDLYKKIGSFAGVARELTRLGVQRPRPGEWNGDYVRDPLVRYARKHGIDLAAPRQALRAMGSKPLVSDAVGETIWRLRYVEKQTLREIAERLKRQGIKSPTGRDDWPLMTIRRAAMRFDDAKRYAAEQLREAA
jgi:DNA invertase Pin-like site-specific DNA recombinase